jgi:hypothetical protein
MLQGMKESCRKGIANHPDLESCRVGREAKAEAETEAFAGRVLSFENPIGDADLLV